MLLNLFFFCLNLVSPQDVTQHVTVRILQFPLMCAFASYFTAFSSSPNAILQCFLKKLIILK